MLDIHRTDATPDTKIYFTHSVLPSYIDPQNVSTKKKPFSTFNKQKYSQTLDLLLPGEIYELIRTQLDRTARTQYARAHMKLGDILEPEFLQTYIKQGNIAMLSEGRPLIDDRFDLYDGTLRMELTRPTYERCGLAGKPMEDGGKKHQKQRWVIEYDLRAPSMKHEKRGFERLQWACANVLDRSLVWLFYNFNPSADESLGCGKEALSKHAPWLQNLAPHPTAMKDVVVPRLAAGQLTSLYEEEDALSLLEYVHLLNLGSPRVNKGDGIDPHLSRYEVPDFGTGHVSKNMVRVRWVGFLPPALIRELFLMVWNEGFKGKRSVHVDREGSSTLEEEEARDERWFCMSAQGFGGGNAWTVMQFEGRETLAWEMER
ncbi:hypothetical protein BDW02DRAFT_574708 [Decorospora gaudefroyi]|uniref:Uncharacterized protein n=1 Tax=Decorospora gaudefroyi TaxID=184978 RepID=A0A6A5JYP3_9PLEO|nr:hypothetical protein BDW02DRAFT_574708 [Decorospora gaudefroyi]